MKVALWCAVALLIGSYICLPVADPDLWWHITIGRWIVSHTSIPHVDYWNMFGTDLPWRAYSWSSEIVLALVDAFAGDRGLFLTQLILAVSLAAALQFTLGWVAQDRWVGSFFGVFCTLACYNHFTLRPQVLVWIYFALLVACIEEVRRTGLSKRLLVIVFALGAAWANTHLTAILGLGTVILWLLPSPGDRRSWRPLSASAFSFFLGTLCTPYFGGEWITFLAKSGHPLKYSVIAEFQPATILQYSTVFVLLLLVLLQVVAFTTRVTPSFGRAILAGGMVIAGLTAVKFLPFAAITLGALLSLWWRDVSLNSNDTSEKEGIVDGISKLRSWCNELSPMSYGAFSFLLVSISISSISNLIKSPLDLGYVPKGAVDFILENNLSHPVLNEFGAGGYLMYRFSKSDGVPSHKVAIDGRTNVNPPEVWQMYQESFLGKLGWRRFIEKVQPKTILWRQGSAFVALLYASKQWCRVYSGGERESDYVVFIRREDYDQNPEKFSSNNCSGSDVGYKSAMSSYSDFQKS